MITDINYNNKNIIRLVLIVMVLVIVSPLIFKHVLNGDTSNYLLRSMYTQVMGFIGILYLKLYYKPPKNSVFKSYCIRYMMICIIVISIANFPYKLYFTNAGKPLLYQYIVSLDNIRRLLFIAIWCFLIPLIEELFMRYYSYNIIKAKYGVSNAVIASSFLFMLFHGLPVKINILLLGVVFALIYEKTNNIWSSIIVHSATNIIWFTLVYFA
jgi:membrane protease YdiL (CAAX protease family)